jgi:hypothetical protein
MRNEVSFSSAVALDGPSRHVCWFDEEAYLRIVQARDHVIKGDCKETENLDPRDPLRGLGHGIEKASLMDSSSLVTS